MCFKTLPILTQARDFDFVATEMKYDSTGMFHWTPSRPIDDCILVRPYLIKNKDIFISHSIFWLGIAPYHASAFVDAVYSTASQGRLSVYFLL